MTKRAFILINLIVIATLVSLVSKEMNFVVIVLDEAEAARFVPAFRENFKRGKTANAVMQINALHLFLQGSYEWLPDVRLLLEFNEVFALLLCQILALRRDHNCSVTIFQERSPEEMVKILKHLPFDR